MVDYQGQKISEYLYVAITCAAGFIAWFIGYWKNDFQVSVHGWAIGIIISVILCVPDWPMYNKKPVTWLKRVGSTETDEDLTSVSKKSKNKSKDKDKDKNKDKDMLKEGETLPTADEKVETKKGGNNKNKRKDASLESSPPASKEGISSNSSSSSSSGKSKANQDKGKTDTKKPLKSE